MLFRSELVEPVSQPALGFMFVHSLQAREIHGLLANLHLAIEAAFLGKIAYASDVGRFHGATVEYYLAAVWSRYAVENPYQCCFSGTVRAKQSEYPAASDRQRHIVESHVALKPLGDIPDFY